MQPQYAPAPLALAPAPLARCHSVVFSPKSPWDAIGRSPSRGVDATECKHGGNGNSKEVIRFLNFDVFEDGEEFGELEVGLHVDRIRLNSRREKAVSKEEDDDDESLFEPIRVFPKVHVPPIASRMEALIRRMKAVMEKECSREYRRGAIKRWKLKRKRFSSSIARKPRYESRSLIANKKRRVNGRFATETKADDQ